MGKKEILRGLDEDFHAVGIRTVDTKRRIGLGEKIVKLIPEIPEAYKVYINKEGDILLRPVVTIPSREAWIYQNAKVLKKIRRGILEAKQGITQKAKNLDEFLEEL